MGCCCHFGIGTQCTACNDFSQCRNVSAWFFLLFSLSLKLLLLLLLLLLVVLVFFIVVVLLFCLRESSVSTFVHMPFNLLTMAHTFTILYVQAIYRLSYAWHSMEDQMVEWIALLYNVCIFLILHYSYGFLFHRQHECCAFVLLHTLFHIIQIAYISFSGVLAHLMKTVNSIRCSVCNTISILSE